jgi:hypothetical protein
MSRLTREHEIDRGIKQRLRLEGGAAVDLYGRECDFADVGAAVESKDALHLIHSYHAAHNAMNYLVV